MHEWLNVLLYIPLPNKNIFIHSKFWLLLLIEILLSRPIFYIVVLFLHFALYLVYFETCWFFYSICFITSSNKSFKRIVVIIKGKVCEWILKESKTNGEQTKNVSYVIKNCILNCTSAVLSSIFIDLGFCNSSSNMCCIYL